MSACAPLVCFVTVIVLGCCSPALGGQPRPAFPIDSDPTYGAMWMKPFGDQLVVSNSPGRLYFTRGTPGSTREVDLETAVGSMSQLYWSAALGSALIVGAEGPGAQVFRSDGTQEGTYTLAATHGVNLHAVDGVAYFWVEDSWMGHTWRTDGTVAGTGQVCEGNVTVLGRIGSEVASLRHNNGTVELWMSAQGVLLGRLVQRWFSNDHAGMFRWCTEGVVFTTTTTNAPYVRQFWLFDGANVRPFGGQWYAIDPHLVLEASLGSTAYYLSSSADVPHGPAVWSWQCGGGEMTQVSRIPQTTTCGLHSAVLGSRFLLSATVPVGGVMQDRVVRVDMQSHSAELLSVNLTGGDDNSGVIVACRGRAYFGGNDGVHGRELWSTDGTIEGTAMVADIRAGWRSSMPCGRIVAVHNRLFFEAHDDEPGHSLWVLDLLPGDFNNDTAVSVDDVLAYVVCYLSGDDRADTNNDGWIGTADLYTWLREYFTAGM